MRQNHSHECLVSTYKQSAENALAVPFKLQILFNTEAFPQDVRAEIFPEVYQRIDFITGIASKIKYSESKGECQKV